jgi:cyclic pyranopterin phosphate synthase
MNVQLGIPQLREGGAPDSGSQPLSVARPAGVPAGRPADAPAGLADRYGRRATDMRLSLTDKCNLRCTYCMPAEGLEWLSKQAVMTGEEIVRIVGIGVHLLGVRELRLTGGEPLVRADLVDIIGALRQAHPELPISMTTNGVGLDRKAAALKAAGLTRINVSLDSLHEETFTKLTRRPFLDRVLAGVDAAWAAGLGPVKLNAVLMRGMPAVPLIQTASLIRTASLTHTARCWEPWGSSPRSPSRSVRTAGGPGLPPKARS